MQSSRIKYNTPVLKMASIIDIMMDINHSNTLQQLYDSTFEKNISPFGFFEITMTNVFITFW